eukprot:scaffold75517_cov32-Tisochrysis_lutea.AAC.3
MAARVRGARLIYGPKSRSSCGKTRSRCSGRTSADPHDTASLKQADQQNRKANNVTVQRSAKRQ